MANTYQELDNTRKQLERHLTNLRESIYVTEPFFRTDPSTGLVIRDKHVVGENLEIRRRYEDLNYLYQYVKALEKAFSS